MTDEQDGPTGPMAEDAPARDRARLAAAVADDKKGLDTIILDVGDVLAICELFVITSAPNTRLHSTRRWQDRQLKRGGCSIADTGSLRSRASLRSASRRVSSLRCGPRRLLPATLQPAASSTLRPPSSVSGCGSDAGDPDAQHGECDSRGHTSWAGAGGKPAEEAL